MPWFYSAQAYAQEVTYNNDTSAPTLDAMNAVKMYFPILSSSLKSSNIETKANTAISKLATDLKNYNDNFSIGGKNSSLKETDANDTQKGMLGGWFHKSTEYVDQMWLDGAYMGSATLAQLAEYYNGKNNIFGSTSADWNMVTKQLNIVWNNCWDSNKQLMYHAVLQVTQRRSLAVQRLGLDLVQQRKFIILQLFGDVQMPGISLR